MRCLIDIRPLLESRRAGVGQVTFNLLKELVERLPETSGPPMGSAGNAQPSTVYRLFGHAWKRPWPDDLPPAAPGRIEHCRLDLPSRPLNLAVSLLGRPRLEELAGDFQAAWLPNLNFAATRRPYAVTVHDLSFVRFPEFFSAKQRLWHAAIRPRRLLARAARVMAVSEHTKIDLIESYGLPEDRVVVINPAAGPAYRPAGAEKTEQVRRKYGLPERFFLFLGTIEPRKNIDGLISAFGALKTEAHLIIAGGRGWLWRGAFRQAAVSPARERIRFLDYVDEADKPALYSSALALTYPSFYEGFGLPPLEAMACGCPVIASYASSLGEVVGNAGLLVDPHDLNELTEAMRLVLTEPGLAERMASAGLERAKSFSWRTAAAKLDIILREIGS